MRVLRVSQVGDALIAAVSAGMSQLRRGVRVREDIQSDAREQGRAMGMMAHSF